MADLRSRRLELTRAALRETVVAGELDAFRAVVEELASELDPMDVAAAAVKLAHQASHAESGAQADEQDVPNASLPRERPGFGERRPQQDRGPRREGRGPREEPRRQGWDTARIFVGVGRMDGLRPGDLVGAIANEAQIRGDAIGAIEIADRFALVEVPAEAADDIIQALRATKIRGRKPVVRRDRES